jgi:hypothetical protein
MTKRKRKLKMTDLAPANFEPVSADTLEKLQSVTDEGWLNHLTTLRLAFIGLSKTKEELKEVTRAAQADGYPEGGNYEGVVIAVRTYLKRRKKADAASVLRVRQRYCRPGALERGLKILAQELDAHQASEPSKEAGVATEKTKGVI